MSEMLLYVLLGIAGTYLCVMVYRSVKRDLENNALRKKRLMKNFGVVTIKNDFPIDQRSEEIIQGVFDVPIQAYNELLIGDVWLYIQVTSLAAQNNNFSNVSPWSVSIFARELHEYFPDIACTHTDSSIRKAAFIREIEDGRLVLCEGVFNKDYHLYARPDMRLDVLSILSPEVLEIIQSSPHGSSLMLRRNMLYYILPGNLLPEEVLGELLTHSSALSGELEENAHRWASSGANQQKLQTIKSSELGVTLQELAQRDRT